MIHVVTEGETEAGVIRLLLQGEMPAAMPSVSVRGAGGRSSADSLARSLLAVRQEPVALVVDADADSPHEVSERRRFLEQSLLQVANRPLWRVILMVPQFERIFLHTSVVFLSRLIGRQLSSREYAEGRRRPKEAMLRWFGSESYPKSMLVRLRSINSLQPLLAVTEIRQLTAFVLQQLQRQGIRVNPG